jgi:hypothetical protein
MTARFLLATALAAAVAACARKPPKGDECVAAAKLINETNHQILAGHLTVEAYEAGLARVDALTIHDRDVAAVVAKYRAALRAAADGQRAAEHMVDQAMHGDTTAADRALSAGMTSTLEGAMVIPQLKEACRDAFPGHGD